MNTVIKTGSLEVKSSGSNDSFVDIKRTSDMFFVEARQIEKPSEKRIA
jgi:hypothetical protein